MKNYAQRKHEALAEAEFKVLHKYGLTDQKEKSGSPETDFLLFCESCLKGGKETYEERYVQQQSPEFKAALEAVRPLAKKLTQITVRPIKTGEIGVIKPENPNGQAYYYEEW